jgi:uncharacterized membrane protein
MTVLELIGLILLSMSPLGEHKVGIPLALGYHIEPLYAWLICTAANLVSPPIIWYFLKNINHRLIKYDFYRKHAFDLARYSKRKLGDSVDKYGFWGIMIFIMIPLPMTGTYTGLVAAWMVGLHKKPALLAAYLGLILSSIIVIFVYTGVFKAIG